jgi:outer membrane protein OmpA-like peptidoglycan-associated protein
MKQFIIITLAFTLPILAQAQLGGLLKKVKNKVEDRVEAKVDKSIDQSLDKAEGKHTGNTTAPDNTASVASHPTIVTYSKFDFIPGEKVIYSDDFAQDAIGELPVNWNASGKGEVVTMEKVQGKWLRLFPGISYLSGNKQSFGENFTIEFDVIIDGTPPSGTRFFPFFNFGFFSSGDKETGDNSFLKSMGQSNAVNIIVHPNVDAGSRMEMNSRDNSVRVFNSGLVQTSSLSQTFFKSAHYAIQVQKQRCRFWVNEQKVFDVPKAISLSSVMNQFYIDIVGSPFYNENNFGIYISNLKVATGVPDTRHKLIEEGKFSTTGILFDFQSAVIKPESYGVIKEIATVLKENPSVKIKVLGHTSSDGDDAANMELSKKRAAAVKELMVKEHGLEEPRIVPEGKGETQPVGDNKTKEGKAQNRRVEFIKL